ncbi:unnamed protein product [Lactuca virosa]|uniref:Zinc finger GRF-type domain-containing protein n=1 Tax=Lactuca virosa TaxID=75947 RepID=A0AAU9NFI7_9ASTR|nr:unnamed protein product [Lactuca virosa]
MSSSSSTSRNQLQVARVQSRKRVKLYDCGVPAKARTCWKITNHGRHFWNFQNNLTRLKKCSFFEWKDKEQEEGYYKNLLYSLKRKPNVKEDMSEMNNLRMRIVEVEFLMSQVQSKVTKSEKYVSDSRKAIGRYSMIVSLLFACLVFCVLKLGGECS